MKKYFLDPKPLLTFMQVMFQTTKADYKSFFHLYFFNHTIGKRLLFISLFALFIGSLREPDETFKWSSFCFKTIVAAILGFLLIAVIPYLFTKIRFRNAYKKQPNTGPEKMSLEEQGITIWSNEVSLFWRWETLNKAGIVNRYLYFTLFTNELYIIPISAFQSGNEAVNFVAIIKNNIQNTKHDNNQRRIRNLHYWGLLGFVPNIGFIAGIILTIKGLRNNSKSLIGIGVADMLFTICFWVMFMRLAPISEGFSKVSQMQLNSLVKDIEFYKLQHGQYPDSLPQLVQENQLAPIVDPIQTNLNRKNINYQYQKTGSRYNLFSLGVDGIAHTRDDLVPEVNIDSTRLGLIPPR
jgi:hypothetical protein